MTQTASIPPANRAGESGNVLIFILIAVALIGIVTAAIRSGSNESANIDDEQMIIRVSEVRQYASELERAVTFIIQNGASENDIRFAHGDAPSDYGDINTNPQNQVFHRSGGGAEYRVPPIGIQVAPASWEFYGNTALPRIGSQRADLVAVLPNVNAAFCAAINRSNNLTAMPQDTGTCVHSGAAARFDDGTQFDNSPNTMDLGSFDSLPAGEACVECDDGTLNFYHVLMTR